MLGLSIKIMLAFKINWAYSSLFCGRIIFKCFMFFFLTSLFFFFFSARVLHLPVFYHLSYAPCHFIFRCLEDFIYLHSRSYFLHSRQLQYYLHFLFLLQSVLESCVFRGIWQHLNFIGIELFILTSYSLFNYDITLFIPDIDSLSFLLTWAYKFH